MLEVGTGFHPELTGRENVYLNGSILGMTRRYIDDKFDEIVSFADVAQFLDTPVKRYSTGMQVRLGFAVAAHLDPEILVVDEVLAVGDMAFQKKCLGKLQEVSGSGRTVLFVSHNMAAVQALCTTCICLNRGRAVIKGAPARVIPRYLHEHACASTNRIWSDQNTAPGNHHIRLRRATVRPSNGTASDPITVRTPITLEFEFWNLKPNSRLNCSVHLVNADGITIFNTFPVHEPRWNGKPFPPGLFRSVCQIPGDLLNDGTHRIHVMFVEDQARIVWEDDAILTFDVIDSADRRTSCHGKIVGAIRPDLPWSTELLSD